MTKKRKYIIGIIVIVWFAFFITDFSFAKANKSPIFAVPVIMYKDGGSTEYYGLGYKVIRYVNLTVEKDTEVVKTDFGTWFMKSSFPELTDVIPMVRIEGRLYLDTGKESDIEARCGVMDGKITSTVEPFEKPTQDNQSNFGSGYEYQFVNDNSIDIYMNEKWIRFENKD